MRELQKMTSRQRSRTLPSRTKYHRENEPINGSSKARTRSKTPLPFRKVVEFLRRRKQKTELDPELFSLERQGWFHGKVTAEYAERPLRKNGDFLVREEPATPGTYFLVLRHQGSTLVMPIVKGKSSKSSKSSRIKYRIDGLDHAYESIPELVSYYWHERKTVSKNAQILIIRPISRDTTLLSADDKPKPKRLELEKMFEPYNHEIDGVRTLDHDRRKWMKRQESDPVISPRHEQFGKSFDLDIQTEQILKQKTIENNHEVNLKKEILNHASEKSEELEVSKDPEKKNEYTNINNNNTLDVKPLSGHINSSVHSSDTLKSRSWSNMERSEKNDAPVDANSAPSLVRSTSSTDTDSGVYSTPRPVSDQSNSSDDRKMIDDGYYCSPRSLESGSPSSGETAQDDTSFQDYAIPNSRPASGDTELDLSSSFSFPKDNGKKSESSVSSYDRQAANGESSYEEADMDYAVPSSRPVGDQSEDPGSVYDVPPTSRNSKSEETTTTAVAEAKSNSENCSERQKNTKEEVCQSEEQNSQTKPRSPVEAKPKSPIAVAPKRKEEIYQGVVKKLNLALVGPFLRYDTATLARHLTRADIDVLWQRDLYKPANEWKFEDGSGGAVGLELIMLPQGRDRRAALLNRYENLKFWVAAVLISAGDVLTRKKVLEKMIDLADALCACENGNMISFMALMEGLTLPQVTRLHHTWSCLHHHNSPRAISYHSTLKPLVGLLASGAPSPFPGVCLPYLIPIARYLEMSTDEIFDDLVYDDIALGIETMMGHLDTGRSVMEQLEVYRNEAMKKLVADQVEEPVLLEYFKSKFVVADLLGLAAEGTGRSAKISTLLQWLSENVEHSGRPSLSSDSS